AERGLTGTSVPACAEHLSRVERTPKRRFALESHPDGRLNAPPSMTMVWPVIHDDRSPARNSAALAMSCGSPSRRNGIRFAIASSAGSHNARAMSVLMRPGAIALTRTPGDRSIDSVLVRWMSAALVTL